MSLSVGGTSRLRRRAVAAVAAAALAAGAVVAASTTAAVAAVGGVGWGTFGGRDTAYKGTFREGGVAIVCAEAGKALPTDPLRNAGLADAGWLNSNLMNEWGGRPGVSANQVAGINRLMTEYGGTQDRNAAAAIEYAVRAVLYPSVADYNWVGDPMGSVNDAINWDLYSEAGIANVQAIQNYTTQYINLINSTVAGTGSTGSGTLAFTRDTVNDYTGTVTMEGTANSTGSITLTNGVFVSTGTSTLDNARANTTYAVTGLPPEDGSPYRISGTGTFTAPGTSGYAANVTVFLSSNGQQNSLGAGGMASNQPFRVSGEDPETRSTVFAPVVHTTAKPFIQKGEKFHDVLTFSTVANSAGKNQVWFRSSRGNYAPIFAEGVVYGPFEEQPSESADVPAGAPVAATMSVTTTQAEGPTIDYAVDSVESARESGFYTIVWTIDYSKQAQGAQRSLTPGYRFQDRFGLVAESSVVPAEISAVSQITASEIALSGLTNDKITVSANGVWPKVAGAPIAVVMRGTAYFVPGEDAPAQQPASAPLPEGTVEVGSTTLTVTKAGEYTPETGIEIVDAGIGHITWVWKIDPADQTDAVRPFVVAWADDFGIPAETQKVLQPEVTTTADPNAFVGTSFTDTATVTGTLPVGGAGLHFELYAATKNDAGEWVCEAGNLLWTSEQQWIEETGEYVSAPAPGQAEGEYHWVEVLTGKNQGEIHRGECGLVDETTIAVKPTVKTIAQAGAKLSGTITDTAVVEGELPEGGAQLSFQAYKVPMIQDATGRWVVATPEAEAPVEGETPAEDAEGANPLAWVCTDDNLVFTSAAQTITEAGEYNSEQTSVDAHGKYLWVETLAWDKPVIDPVTREPVLVDGVQETERVQVHRGECGVEDETSFVVDVKTQAKTTNGSQVAAFGEDFWDTAELTGYVPEGGAVVFEVYRVAKGAAASCTAETLVTTLDATTGPLAGGLYTKDAPLVVESTRMKNDVTADTVTLFMEVTTDRGGREVSRGECGDPSETVTTNAEVPPPGLAFTGSSSTVILYGGLAAAVLIGLGLVTILIIRRRQARVA